ncbi:MAG: hypothetical protein JWN12_354 [Candidatus Saccharibacteria bacterium]|nr:hypothetical protein [Candidatus Saccharibacteria bacterium]
MFEKTPPQSEDSLPSRPDLQSFLSAQNERLQNKYDIHGNGVTSGLGELVVDKPDPVNFLSSMNQLPVEEKKRFFVDNLKHLMDIMYQGFNDSRLVGDKYYDPLDDETFIGHTSFDGMNDAEKKMALRYLSEYLIYLESIAHGRRVRVRPIGRHAASQVVEL